MTLTFFIELFLNVEKKKRGFHNSNAVSNYVSNINGHVDDSKLKKRIR